MKDPRPL